MRRLLRAAAGPTALVPAALAVLTGYLAVLTGAAWWARRNGRHVTPLSAKPTTRFAILVPAHDEEQLIGSTVKHLLTVDYPQERFAVHVVADHCTDRTAELATAAGAEVHMHDDPDPAGKGPALAWLRARLDARGDAHDAVVIVDADSAVDPRFLRVLDAKLAGGARVVQGHYTVRDPEESTSAGVRAAALALRHYTRPLGRTALGASCGLYGNGMGFTADVLRGRDMSDHLTEDLELQTELVLEGETVVFAPDAVVEAEMPATLTDSRTQNERWERGRLDLARQSIPRLVRCAAHTRGRRRVAALDTALDHAVPPLSVLAAGVGAATLWSLVTDRLLGGRLTRFGWRASQLAIAALAFHVLAGLRVARVPATVYRALAGAPKAIVWKVVLWARMLLRPDEAQWIRTTRNPGSGTGGEAV